MKSSSSKTPSGWFLYMLRCADGSLYTGIAKDLQRRLAVHRSGKGSKYARSRLPVKIAYWEKFSSRSKALKREAEIKSWTRPQKIALISKGKTRRTP